MQMKNELILLSGADIPFIEGRLVIHQPSIYEISYLGETVFYNGCEMLKFSKNILQVKDKNELNNYSDFDILMSIMNDNNSPMIFNISCAKQVLDLIFPLYIVVITPQSICFFSKDNNELQGEINNNNFQSFKEYIIDIFCLKEVNSEQGYNTQGELANKIAEQLENRHKKLAKLKSNSTSRVAILSRYISILAVGQHKDINALMKYTVYQLFDEFQRFQLKQSVDQVFQARLAGAQDLETPEDWRKDLHEN